MATNPGALIPHLGTGDVAFLSGALLMFIYLFRKPSWRTEPVAAEPAEERIGEPEPEPV